MVECKQKEKGSGGFEKVVCRLFVHQRMEKWGGIMRIFGVQRCASIRKVMRINSQSHAHQFAKSCASIRQIMRIFGIQRCASIRQVMRIFRFRDAHQFAKSCASIRKLLAGLESLSGIRNGLSPLENFCFRLSCVNFLPFTGLVRQLGRERAPESACREEGARRGGSAAPPRWGGCRSRRRGRMRFQFNVPRGIRA